MPRENLERRLQRLRDDVISFGDAVTVRLRRAVTAVDRRDSVIAETVVEGDHEINERYLQLEGECIDLFALEQPVATDLRTVAASYKILTDLERVADLAGNVAGYVVAAETEVAPDLEIAELGRVAVEMLDDALTAYVRQSPEMCQSVADRDDDLDELCERATEHLIQTLVERDVEDADLETLLEEARRLLLTIRDLERVGDHAVNVAARTLYVVEGDDRLLY